MLKKSAKKVLLKYCPRHQKGKKSAWLHVKQRFKLQIWKSFLMKDT